MTDTPAPTHATSTRTKATVLVLLTMVSTLNFLDRQIVNILAEPIKHDLHLTDGQLGIITGLSFALFYSILGIPIARLADRSHRPAIIAAALFVWSASTAACGLAASFSMLLLARVGVAAGEAGATPPSHSLLSDYTVPTNRASALAIFSLGTPIGSLIGLAAGGLIADTFGWRWAFFLAAAPGILLAPVILFAIREPRRVAVDRPDVPAPPSLGEAVRELRNKPSFWWLAGAAATAAMVTTGHAAFYGSYFLRQHSAALADLLPHLGAVSSVGLILGVVTGVSGIVGTLLGGYITDAAVKRNGRNYCRVPMIAMLVGAPAYASVLVFSDVRLAIVALILPSLCQGALLGATFAAVQTIVSPQVRATATAVLFFMINLIGLGFGPLLIGMLSDWYGASTDVATGLRWAMLTVAPITLVSAFCYWRADRWIGNDVHVTA